MQSPPHLMIPGPTPLPEAVRQAMARPAIGHRSAEFKAIMQRVLPRLQWLFQTQNDVLLITASGTAAMEAAMINTLNAGDKVLVLSCGVFSDRWADMGDLLGLDVTRVTAPHGQANTPESVTEALAQQTFKAVVVTHSETSTGVQNPLEAIAKVVRGHGDGNTLLIVDAVTSMGATPVPVDAWGLDLVVSGSQKGFMIPPGLSFLSVSKRSWQAFKTIERPGLYFNFSKYKKAQDAANTPYTPATHLIMALDEALALMEADGLDAIHARHEHHCMRIRQAARDLGLTLLVDDDALASRAVTAIRPPADVSVDAIRAGLKSNYGLIVANGQKDLQGKIFRIGHLGYQFDRDITMTLAALAAVLAASRTPVSAP